MTIDLESLLEVRDYFADRQDAEQLAGESFPTPNEEMRLLVTVDSVLAELTARRARDAEVEALVAACRLARSYMSEAIEYETPCAKRDGATVDAALAPFTGAKP